MCTTIFSTGRMWSAPTATELAALVFAARARSGVYIFERHDGCALYVGRSLDELGSRVQKHMGTTMARAAVRVWALESTCPGVDEVRLIAALLPTENRETEACPGDHPRPTVADAIGDMGEAEMTVEYDEDESEIVVEKRQLRTTDRSMMEEADEAELKDLVSGGPWWYASVADALRELDYVRFSPCPPNREEMGQGIEAAFEILAGLIGYRVEE